LNIVVDYNRLIMVASRNLIKTTAKLHKLRKTKI